MKDASVEEQHDCFKDSVILPVSLLTYKRKKKEKGLNLIRNTISKVKNYDEIQRNNFKGQKL